MHKYLTKKTLSLWFVQVFLFICILSSIYSAVMGVKSYYKANLLTIWVVMLLGMIIMGIEKRNSLARWLVITLMVVLDLNILHNFINDIAEIAIKAHSNPQALGYFIGSVLIILGWNMITLFLIFSKKNKAYFKSK